MGKSQTKTDLPPTTLVVFGITGDLAGRYILPALAALDGDSLLPENFRLIGLSRRQVSTNDVLDNSTKRLAKYLDMQQMDMADIEDYQRLGEGLNKDSQIIFYLSVPPSAVSQILKNLAKAGLNHGNTKLLLEKPFGYDLESARELVAQTTKCFAEEQIYRIDHYMAKEMAQNIAVFLGSNALFRNIWNNKFIESIEIVAAEKIGIEGRADFYDSTGALRDFVQSHLMNLAALTLMRPCASQSEFADMPARRLEVLEKLLPADPSKSFRAQYEGYRKEVNNSDSTTETFVSVRLASDDPRWRGVPIQLVSGKSLNAKVSEIRVKFKKADESQANSLKLKIQPEEGVEIDLWAKKPGLDQELHHLPLTFSYANGQRLPDAYERVLVDAINSRSSLFAGSDEVLQTWRVLQPILDAWASGSEDLKFYKSGSTVEGVLALRD